MPGPIEVPGPRVLRVSRAATTAQPVERVGFAVGFGPGAVDQPSTGLLAPGTVIVNMNRIRIEAGDSFIQALQLPYTGPAHISGNMHLQPNATGSPCSVKVQGPSTNPVFEDIIEIPTGGVPTNNQYRTEDSDFNIAEVGSSLVVINSTDNVMLASYIVTAGVS